MVKRKTRKRRSFWEPESKELVQWLNNQADLGKSLQLIIVDAMQTYGTGDAVDAYLQQRIDGDIGVKPVSRPQIQEQIVEPVVASKSEPEVTIEDVVIEPEIDTAVVEEVAQTASELVLEGVAKDPEPRVAEPTKEEKPAAKKTSDDINGIGDRYNPLETMFNDVGSSFK